MFMLAFVLFDSCVFQGLGLGLAGFSTINLRLLYLKLIVSAIYSLFCFLHKTLYFILKFPTNPQEKYSNVASAVPFVVF